jgi:aspartyl-tRNA(Asn)/glutamyl-tRNA(Gln) amidotransferase subunit B
MNEYQLTVGLEIHAELKTKTKMFCRCLNNPDEERPNANVCPICMGHPGTLPYINKEAVKHVLKVGASIGGMLADFSEFDRKNYFYPDIPKGYQISQYKYPLVSGGKIAGVELTRIHLEEDTAKSSHEDPTGSLVDFNRAGLPLLELVTEPVIHTAKEAGDFARELQLLFRTLGVAEANMEKGEMRVEANISVAKKNNDNDGHCKLGTKVEVKNLNSFRSVERAIEFEMKRHIALLEKGEKIAQETRGWDENKQSTFSQRAKEDSHDYRYFPDPDLPKLKLSEIEEFSIENLKKELPELPWQKRERYLSMGLKNEDANMFVSNDLYGNFFEEVVSKILENNKAVLLAANYIATDVAGFVKMGGFDFPAWTTRNKQNATGAFAKLMIMLDEGKISSRGGKDILKIMFNEGGDPEKIAEAKGLFQKSDTGEIEKMLQEIIAANPNVVAEYKAGKESVLMFFVGQAMKVSKGSANPAIVKDITLKLLSS